MKKPGDFLENHPVFPFNRNCSIYTLGTANGRPRLPLCKGECHGAAVTDEGKGSPC